MNEQTLKSLLQLFAIIANLKNDIEDVIEKNYIESFLKQQFSQDTVNKYLQLFVSYFNEYNLKVKNAKSEKEQLFNDLISAITSNINLQLPLKQKFILLINAFQFIKYSEPYIIGDSELSTINNILKKIADDLFINEIEYNNCKWFVFNQIHKIPEKTNLLIIEDELRQLISGIKQMQVKNLQGQLFILRIKSPNMYLVKYIGESNLLINNNKIFSKHIYILNSASIIKGDNIKPVYFDNIAGKYIDEHTKYQINFVAENIEFRFKNSENGIHPFSFSANSGQMIGIMGSSGVGKSTLLNILNGKYPLYNGKIMINDTDIHDKSDILKGIIGYIPQDDLLIEELTVYENLYFNAQLCFGNLSKDKIKLLVDNILVELELYEAKHLKVGSPTNKFISGGQRKRLNIALELIREPYVLFVDEPTSGLSSNDSLKVMQLLKEQTLKGKLLIINIHQPSSELFKMFDKLIVLDKGGYPIYYGNPVESITYFKQITQKVDLSNAECPSCGNINPEEILSIIEEKDINEYGEFIEFRKISPGSWYSYFKKNISKKFNLPSTDNKILPKNDFTIPNPLRQFVIYSFRNLKSKLKDRQYVLMSAIIAPLLAIILAFFSKFVIGAQDNPLEYVFSKNENLPGYLFMSVVVALFIGLIISAEEIIHDKKILERERFLSLSKISYLNSKILFLFILSAFQMLIFVLIGNYILEIKGMVWQFWIILFSTACFANMVGLFISNLLNSVIAIYILVPFLLVPQLLLSGTIIKFDKLHYTLASQEHVPVVGDIMASRWAYESLMTTQFKSNAYQINYFDIEQQESNYSYQLKNLIPELEIIIQDCINDISQPNKIKKLTQNFNILKHELYKLNFNRPLPFFPNLYIESFDNKTVDEITIYLEKQKSFLKMKLDEISIKKDNITSDIINKLGLADKLVKLKQTNYNESIADLVLNNNEFRIIYREKNKLIQKSYPIYKVPDSNLGRAHFFSSTKKIAGYSIDTLIFNVLVIWIMSFIIYCLLITNSIKKIIEVYTLIQKKAVISN